MTDRMAALRARFLARAAEDLMRLRGPDALADAELGARVHQLAGAAGVFGFPELSRLAAIVDHGLHRGEAVDLIPLIAALESLPEAG